MGIFGILVQVGILWFLITFYSRSTNSSATLSETWIVVLSMLAIGFVARLLLSGILGPFVGILPIIALYFLIDKVCGLPQRATIKICVYYVLIVILIGVANAILMIPVDAQ
ncbi:hypothetical protein NT6N_24910 [Oceaniferula spumae]|uniref:Uncharacterized protein n=1 Tax=Oceaniferula spumae TaxID=2979115 RepID=A0AAT9FN59_9BACT